MIIKICGITKVEDARFAIKMGANWVGIVQHPDSIRYVDLETTKAISFAVRDQGGEPVGVFVNAKLEEMIKICRYAELRYVQLHGAISRQQHHLLPEHLTRIYAISVQYDGAVSEDFDQGERYLNSERDYLLFDGATAGSGRSFIWQNFQRPAQTRFLVAGGLNPTNVKAVIDILAPDGVDVSSGIEEPRGFKSQKLIHDFIVQAQ